VQAGKRAQEKFMHTHKLYHSKELYERRLLLFAQAREFCGTAAVTQAKRLLAMTLTHQLRVLQEHLDAYRQRITKLFAQHPDHDLFGSLPGTGPKLAPRLLAELGDDRARFDSAEGLQCYAGTAPVSYQSGKIRKSRLRRACQLSLRAAVHHWANLSRKKCVWADAYYDRKREQGMNHACALRCLGQRWIKILWKMWQTHTRYDADLHQRNQIKHGSWVLALVTAPSNSAAPATP
jgi:transposase